MGLGCRDYLRWVEITITQYFNTLEIECSAYCAYDKIYAGGGIWSKLCAITAINRLIYQNTLIQTVLMLKFCVKNVGLGGELRR